ncbi:MAG: tandem-95 repeat protein [Cyclobacteriaceae bacterium]|nr:tandem-95 repeat protein [Cyclobacteriaceae bacterium]
MKDKMLPNRHVIITLLILFCASSLLWAQNQTAKLTPVSQIGYLEYLPPDYNSNSDKYPIVIFFHGIGERGNGTTEIGKVWANGPPKHVQAGYKFPFILISPQLKTAYGNWPAWYMDEVVEHVRTYLRVDPARIYVCGLSLGGGGAWEYGYTFPQKVAALVPVCGGYNAMSKACVLATNNIPIWASHGDKDTVVPMSRTVNFVNAINACTPAINPPPILTIYPNVAHNAWDYAFRTDNSLHTPNVYQWMMGFTKGGISVGAGPDITLSLPTNSTNITGTASTSTGTITSYSWTKLSGPAVTIANASSTTVSLSGMVLGIYTFRLTVTNSLGQTGTDDVNVTVVGTNQNPTANAGVDKTITLPTNSLNLTGSGSDPDGSIVSYFWSKVSGPPVSISGQTNATVSLSGMVQGTYVFSLTVTDNNGATATDNVTVLVNAAVSNQAPIANAGPDKTINLPTNSTTLSGSGSSDPDGSITAYLWEKLSGPTATLTNANAATVSVSALVAGTYVFRLTVTDNLGATANDQATVTVVGSNQPPVANAGSAITLTLPTNSTTISGSGTDADGSVVSYAWSQVSGPNTASLTNATNPTLTVNNLIQGAYIFRLIVTDNLGATGLHEVTVTVNTASVNKAPFANAGLDKTITLPVNSVVIVGSGNDLDGTIVSYSWTKFSGPTASLTNENTNTLTASALVAGTYMFRLTVTDNLGATGADNIMVTVQPAAVNQSPLVDIGPDFTLTLPTNSTTIPSTAIDPDGTIATYLWEKISGSTATLSGITTSTLGLTNLVVGTYVFRLTVTDNLGANASDDVTVTVATGNQPPVVVASNDETITLPTSSTNLIAVASDPDGSIASYLWTNPSGPAAPTMGGATTASLSVSGLVVGTYIFRITVTDNNGATAFDEVNITVQSAANISPIASAGADKSITLPTNSTNFTGSGSDADGTIASYAWTQVNGTAVTLTNANTQTVSVTVVTNGSYTFRLTVTDNLGAKGFDDVVLLVNPAAANQPPVANAGPNRTITLPSNSLNLAGSGSDADGSITAYQWTKVSGPTATLTNATTPTLSLSNLVQGSYVFRLTVTDNGGLTNFANVNVSVLPASVNLQPAANAGSDMTLTLPINSATLFGNGSDPDGSIVSYSWSKVSGPAATLAGNSTQTLSLSGLVQGVYVFRLMVTDNGGATASDDATVTVNPVATNQAPIANAGADKVITLPTNSTNLVGSGSDADGSISTYGWIKVSGPTVTLGATNAPTLSLTNLVEGIYTFRLQVTDNNGATASDDVLVTVNPAALNQSPVVSAGSDKTIFLPTNSSQLSGSASDPDGTIASQIWTQVSGPSTATLTNASTTLLTTSNLVVGVYKFRFTATDDKSASAFAEVLVTVNAAAVNQPPAANAGSDQTIKLPANNITLAGLGIDPDGTIASYSWIKVSGPPATLTNANTATLSVSGMLEGSYLFRLTVTDNLGATGTDDVSVIVLAAATNTPPQVNAGPDVNVVLPANTATLIGTVTDDGTIATTVWTKVSGPPGFMAGSNSTTLSVSNLTAGTYVFRLTVTDGGGLTGTDDATVTVFPATVTNLPPSVDAGPDQLIQLPVNSIQISAIASDPDGIIASYKWTQSSGKAVTISPDNTNVLALTNLVPGTYSFIITVKDGDNLPASDEVTIVVREQDPIVKAFNMFSPDGRGEVKTETWHIVNADLITDCDVTVYNRQGIRVFESRGYSTEWDGTYNGKLLPSGVYFYLISCAGKATINGTVTLIR